MPVTSARVNAAAALFTLLIGTAQSARADDVSIELFLDAQAGHEKPAIEVTTEKPLRFLELTLTRSDGANVHLKQTGVKAGAKRRFTLEQPEGTFHYEGTLVAEISPGDTTEFPLSFDTHVCETLNLSFDDGSVDLKAHTATIAVNHPITALHVQVQADDGHVLAEYEEEVTDARPGQPIRTTWIPDDPAATVMRIGLRATDACSFFNELDLFPWKIEIPHEDALFDTGRSDILPAERPKLDTAYDRLAAAIEKYGRWANVQLFVEGHTDTVGDAATNKTLSGARALAIAKYFRSRGVHIPVYYAGFGKDGLLVPTPDQTAEPRNRRAAYVVSVAVPGGVHWTRLP